ncbi:MAG: hypothetical protein P8179_18740 [Candidatus Thiodiazotropha sp.]
MSTMKDVICATHSFFEKHWCEDEEIPQWSDSWDWKDSVPNHDKSGVYALIAEDKEVVYIGVGASRGGGRYKNHGLSYRLLNHVITTDKNEGRGHYKAQDRWKDIKGIYTIGFPEEYSYISLALEDYLIAKLQPKININKK